MPALGHASVYVAQLDADDVDENTAARRVVEAVYGPGLQISGVASGRANLLSNEAGILRVDIERLNQLNECEGITLATLKSHTPGHARQIVATVKIIPYAVPESVFRQLEAIRGGNRPIVHVDTFPSKSVGIIFSGSASLHQRLTT